MTEGISILERPRMATHEIHYPGFTTSLFEITTSGPHVGAITDIEKKLDPKKYGGVDKNPTPEKNLNWLSGGTIRNFDNINLDSSKAILAGINKETTPVESIVIATTTSDKTGKLTSYTNSYTSLNFPELPKERQDEYGGKANLDITYVSGEKDPVQNEDPEKEAKKTKEIVEISESLMLTAMLFWEKAVGKSIDKLTGEFTPEQMILAHERLAIFADATPEENQTNYREALKKAGFKEIHRYEEADDDDGGKLKEYIVYNLPLAGLTEAFKQRKTQTSS